MLPEQNIPVIIGVGQINDRPEQAVEGMDSLELAVAALKRAENDAGGDWLRDIDTLLVVDQMSMPNLGDLSGPIADAIGASPSECRKSKYPMGDSPVRFLNEAANKIAVGEAKIVGVTGAEALRTAAARTKAQRQADNVNVMRDHVSRSKPSYRSHFGLSAPVDVYPLYENAMRAAAGKSLTESQRESADLWSGMSEVAAQNPSAWLNSAVTPEDILDWNSNNRPISFPYTKLQVANASVNQGAAFLVTSFSEARKRGVPEEHLIYVGCGSASAEPGDFLKRDGYTSSASLSETLTRVLEINDLDVSQIDHAELYSCFPCVPKLAKQAIGWPDEKPITVFGGLTFGGGPIGNYMTHAIASMVQKLRSNGRYGLLFGNGGFATTNHTIIIGRDPSLAHNLPNGFDFQAEADARRGHVPEFVEAYKGPGKIETYTLHYNRDGSVRIGVIVGLTPDGTQRFLVKVPAEDTELLTFLTNGENEPVGHSGEAYAGAERDQGIMYWRNH